MCPPRLHESLYWLGAALFRLHSVFTQVVRFDSWHTGRASTTTMTTVNAHFDGKVIIPDEPLDLPPNQPLIVSIEPVAEKRSGAKDSVLSWLAANAVASDALPPDLAERHDHYLYGRSNE